MRRQQTQGVVKKNILNVGLSQPTIFRGLSQTQQRFDSDERHIPIGAVSARSARVLRVKPGKSIAASRDTTAAQMADRKIGPKKDASRTEGFQSATEGLALCHCRSIQPKVHHIAELRQALSGASVTERAGNVREDHTRARVAPTQLSQRGHIFFIRAGADEKNVSALRQ